MANMTVEDVMTPNPICLSPDSSALEAARAMRDAGVGDVLVAEGDQLRGIVTDRDIVVRCIAEGGDPSQARIGEFCSGDLVTIDLTDSVDTAVNRLRDSAIRRLPVLSDGQPVGIVSLGDLALTRDPNSALADISAAPDNH